MPWLRAAGGRLVRKSRADLDWAEKGLILVFTSVMNRVIILGGFCWFGLDGGEGRRGLVVLVSYYAGRNWKGRLARGYRETVVVVVMVAIASGGNW